jgi:hypothetical protein
MFLMFVLTLAEGLYGAWFIDPTMRWCTCPEIGISSIDRAQLKKVPPGDGDRTKSPKHCVLYMKEGDGQCRETQQLY